MTAARGADRVKHDGKIFGIGLPRTGTSSLHAALVRLGYRSMHHSQICHRLLNADGRAGRPPLSKVIDHFDAFLDWPICPLFAVLDRHYPGSRFILTQRDPNDRWRSARRAIEQAHATARLRNAEPVWQRKHLAPRHVSVLLEKCFHRRVRRHFRDRDNLLVLRICDGEGWEKLCPFLGHPVRDEPFPRVNITGRGAGFHINDRQLNPPRTNVSWNRRLWLRQLLLARFDRP